MEDWIVEPSEHSMKTENPILEIASSVKVPSDFAGKTYDLTIGDASKYPDFVVHDVLTEAVNKQLLSGTGNGYVNSIGPESAREAIARRFSYPNISLTSDEVIMDVGGMGAIHTLIHAFIDEGDNILIPSPGFTLYQSIARNIGADAKLYRLLPDQEWEVDFSHLDELVDERTRLLVVVNPSNPCGSIFSREHCLAILDWAKRHKICVMTDEVYDRMTFGKPYYPLGSLTEEVPVFTVAALSKNFLCPGWRCGWILIYDKQQKALEIKNALKQLKNMLLHGVPFISNALPEIFEQIPDDYTEKLMQSVKVRADLVFDKITQIPGLSMYRPDGVFYAYVKVDCSTLRDVESSLDFARKLAQEEGVMVLPAECFMSEGAFRVVLFSPIEDLEDSCNRIAHFVNQHLIN